MTSNLLVLVSCERELIILVLGCFCHPYKFFPLSVFFFLSLCAASGKNSCLSSTYDLIFCILNAALLKIDLNSVVVFLYSERS